MNKKYLLALVLGIFILVPFMSASPTITIISPQDTTYAYNKIPVNVVSNEAVDFYYLSNLGKKIILAEDTTYFQSNLYIKDETKTFKVYAENSLGEISSKEVTFSSSHHNPISITECGYLYSSDAEYVLDNDIYPVSHYCLRLYELRNVSIDLQGNTINSGWYDGLGVRFSSDIEIFNGSIIGSNTKTNYYMTPYVLELEGSKYNFHDLYIEGHTNVAIWSLDNSYFTNVTFNGTRSLFLGGSVTDSYLINSSVGWNGIDALSGYPVATGIYDQSLHSELYLVESNVTGFPEYDYNFQGAFTDVYLRSTKVNKSKMKFPEWTADTVLYNQHLVVVDVEDQFGIDGACAIRFKDNGNSASENGVYNSAASNPTEEVLMGIDDGGQGSQWITESAMYAKSSSPAVIEEISFSPYNLTTRGWGANETSSQELSLSSNSTIYVSFGVTVPEQETFPLCEKSSMLDLNGDGVVNQFDIFIITDFIRGKPLSITSSKGCEAVNLDS